MASTATRATGFSIDLPGSWFEFDIWRATRTGDLARMVDARIKEIPELGPHRGKLLKLLRQVALDAERNHAVFCAGMGEISADGSLMATAMAFHTDGMADPRLNTPEAIASQVTAQAPSSGSPHWRTVELVDLPVGRAARTRGVQRVSSADHAADFVVMHTLVPVPSGDGVLTLSLSSPQVALAEPMLDLFAAISSTLTWT